MPGFLRISPLPSNPEMFLLDRNKRNIAYLVVAVAVAIVPYVLDWNRPRTSETAIRPTVDENPPDWGDGSESLDSAENRDDGSTEEDDGGSTEEDEEGNTAEKGGDGITLDEETDGVTKKGGVEYYCEEDDFFRPQDTVDTPLRPQGAGGILDPIFQTDPNNPLGMASDWHPYDRLEPLKFDAEGIPEDDDEDPFYVSNMEGNDWDDVEEDAFGPKIFIIYEAV
ncbi:hypothetical protein DFP72DRAFT_1065949 [Ephemerocybe angulata]|uniref:Uncharacterized protein n=1 Tax=Ephemerocybe angulata TaxID=980116 RepID=A0A8H6I352_9AGAR|nr:hypothetical protein DFP72DRAFT_1065949 [Tulosesus angulatus]